MNLAELAECNQMLRQIAGSRQHMHPDVCWARERLSDRTPLTQADVVRIFVAYERIVPKTHFNPDVYDAPEGPPTRRVRVLPIP